MTIGDRMDRFRARFGLPPGADKEETDRFRKRILNAWDSLYQDSTSPYWLERIEREFATINGSRFLPSGEYLGGARENVHEHLSRPLSFEHVVRILQNILYALDVVSTGSSNLRGQFASMVQRAIELSRGIDLRLDTSGEELELMPAGVSLLDTEAVDPSVEWLAPYPDVQKELKAALRIVAEKKSDQYRQAQDALRFGLEKLLKVLLKNTSPIEEQGKALKAWLTLHGVHEELRGAAVSIMNRLFNVYQNAAIKHDGDPSDGAQKTWFDFEVEYLIYQFATMVRLLMETAKSPIVDPPAAKDPAAAQE